MTALTDLAAIIVRHDGESGRVSYRKELIDAVKAILDDYETRIAALEA